MEPEPSVVKIEDLTPTPAFRRSSWKHLQLKLDPLALPRQLPALRP